MYDVMMKGLDIKTLAMNTMIPGLDLAPTNNFLDKAELELAEASPRSLLEQSWALDSLVM